MIEEDREKKIINPQELIDQEIDYKVLVAILNKKEKDIKVIETKLKKVEEKYVELSKINKRLIEDKSTFCKVLCEFDILQENDFIALMNATNNDNGNKTVNLIDKINELKRVVTKLKTNCKTFTLFLRMIFPDDKCFKNVNLFDHSGENEINFELLRKKYIQHEEMFMQESINNKEIEKSSVLNLQQKYDELLKMNKHLKKTILDLQSEITIVNKEKAKLLLIQINNCIDAQSFYNSNNPLINLNDKRKNTEEKKQKGYEKLDNDYTESGRVNNSRKSSNCDEEFRKKNCYNNTEDFFCENVCTIKKLGKKKFKKYDENEKIKSSESKNEEDILNFEVEKFLRQRNLFNNCHNCKNTNDEIRCTDDRVGCNDANIFFCNMDDSSSFVFDNKNEREKQDYFICLPATNKECSISSFCLPRSTSLFYSNLLPNASLSFTFPNFKSNKNDVSNNLASFINPSSASLCFSLCKSESADEKMCLCAETTMHQSSKYNASERNNMQEKEKEGWKEEEEKLVENIRGKEKKKKKYEKEDKRFLKYKNIKKNCQNKEKEKSDSSFTLKQILLENEILRIEYNKLTKKLQVFKTESNKVIKEKDEAIKKNEILQHIENKILKKQEENNEMNEAEKDKRDEFKNLNECLDHLTCVEDFKIQLQLERDQNCILKNRVRELESSKLQQDTSMDYLKNIIIKYIEYTKKGDSAASSLVPVLATILQTSSEERKRILF